MTLQNDRNYRHYRNNRFTKLEITGDGFLVPEGCNDGQVEVEMKQKIWPDKNASIKNLKLL
jgi:hypothetical protein